MVELTFKKLKPDGSADGSDPIIVKYSPPELSFTKTAQYAEVAIPGLEQPILQFVRGDAETLGMDLFFDGTGAPIGAEKTDVSLEVNRFCKLVTINGETHMPPLVRISWGVDFPGNAMGHNYLTESTFTAVVLSVTRKYTLFDASGMPLRAIVTLSLKRYATIKEQLDDINFQSADHTRLHIVTEGETLPLIAHDAFGDAGQWRVIAEHNGLSEVRDLVPGMRLELPPLVP
ncbi:MAG: CIS tube protein [Allorhizobium sp.]